jgi:hypothetical protein
VDCGASQYGFQGARVRLTDTLFAELRGRRGCSPKFELSASYRRRGQQSIIEELMEAVTGCEPPRLVELSNLRQKAE